MISRGMKTIAAVNTLLILFLIYCSLPAMFLSSTPPLLSPRSDQLFTHAVSRIDDTLVAAAHM